MNQYKDYLVFSFKRVISEEKYLKCQIKDER